MKQKTKQSTQQGKKGALARGKKEREALLRSILGEICTDV